MGRDETCERVYHPRFLAELLSNRVVRRAKHGIAGANGNTFAYSPFKGYVGPDDFTVEVGYRQGTEVGKFLVHWNIVVQ